MTTELFTLSDGRTVAGLVIPGPPAAPDGHAVLRYTIERPSGYCVEYGGDLAETFRSYLARGPKAHELYAEAAPVGAEPDADTDPVLRCEWTEHGWGLWHRG